jgi:hypothetical protein
MESSNGMSQGQDNSSPGITPSVTSQSAPASQPAPVQTSDERTFRQSEVNDIVKKAKYGAVEDFKRLNAEQPNYAQQKYGQPVDNQQPSQPNANFSEDHLRKIASDEIQRSRDRWMQDAQAKSEAESAQRIVQNFWNKISPGKEKYQDFDKVTGDIEYARFPNVVQLLADHVENSHDMLYELGKDRIKMAQLEQLAVMSPRDAIIHAQKLSQSLKDNENAKNIRSPNEPLSQLRPSNTGTDTGVLGVKDLRRKYKV